MFKDLVRRSFIGAFLFVVFACLIFFSDSLVVRPIIFVAILFLGFFANREYMGFVKRKKIAIDRNVLSIFLLFEIAAFFLFSQGICQSVIIFFLPLLMVVLIFFRKKEVGGFTESIALSIFSILYIAVPLGLVFNLLYLNPDGKILVAYIIAVTKVYDIFGYFGGRLIGKRALSKKSPKKTWEGTILGISASALTSFLFFRSLEGIFMGIFFGIFAQVGDLFESTLKRDADIKDSGKFLGGVLDMLDSLIINIIIFYIYIEVVR